MAKASCVHRDEILRLPLAPPLETHYALVWKKNTVLTKEAERFLSMLAGR